MSFPNDRPIALVGLMGAGKSSVARLLAHRLAVGVFGVDAGIEGGQGASIGRLFEEQGEAAFRRLESAALGRAIDSGAGVIDCGGGIVLEEESRVALRNRCRTVWLEVSPTAAAARLAGVADRPLLAGADPVLRLRELLAARTEFYAGVAHLRVATDGRAPEEVAAEIEAWARGGA